MAYETVTAVILRLVEWSESSLVLTLFGRESGKLYAVAKGARRPKAPFDASLDFLACCRMTLIRKTSDALNLATESKLIRWFRLPPDLRRWYAGFYIAELLDAMTETELPIPELFDLTEETLAAFSGGVWNDPAPPVDVVSIVGPAATALMVTRWELVAMRLLGLFPDPDGCSECGEEVIERGRVSFHFPDGLLCPRCRAARRNRAGICSHAGDAGISGGVGFTISIAESTFRFMQRLADPHITLDSFFAANSFHGVPPVIPTELRIILNQWIADQLGRIPRTATYLPDVVGPLHRVRRHVAVPL